MIDSILQMTPEVKAELEALDKENEARLGPLVSDSLSFRVYEGARVTEQNARITIDHAHEMIAESLFWQGGFALAAESTKDPVKATEWRRFSKAFDNLDKPVCLCGPQQIRIPGSAKAGTIPARREIQAVWVGMLEREVKFIQCDVCKQLFAQSV